MPRSGSRCRVWAAAFLGLWVVLLQGQDAFAGLGYSGLWEVNETDGGRLLQLYDNRLTFNLSQDLTGVMSGTESINYNNRWEQEGIVRETVSPVASLMMNGDLLLTSLSAHSLRNVGSSSFEPENDALSFSMGSAWKKLLVPDFRFNYDYTRQNTYQAGLANQTDSQGMGGLVDWDLLLAQIHYNFKRDYYNNQNSSAIDDTQVAKINTNRTWLDNRLWVSLGHEYTGTRNERGFDFTTATTASIPVNLPRVYAGPDLDPADNIDPAAFLPPTFHVVYNPLAPPLPLPAGGNNNSIILVTSGQQIDHVYLYTQNSLGASPLGLSWDYYSNDNGLNNPWVKVSGIIPAPTYDTVNKRFVITLPAIKVSYLKIVVGLNIGAPVIDFTKVEADQVVHGVSGSSITQVSRRNNNKSNVSLDFKFNHAAAFSYAFLLEKEDWNGTMYIDQENQHGTLQLQNGAEDLKSVLQVSLVKSRFVDKEELQNNTYQLDLKKIIFPTLSVALGGSHDESSQGGSRLSDRNRYTFYTDATLYPDLVSRLDVTYWKQNNYSVSLGNSVTDSLQGNFILSSRVRPSMNVSLSDNYEEQSRNSVLSGQQNTVGLSCNWQLSDKLSLNGTAQKTSSKFEHDAYALTAGMTAGFLQGLEVKVNYSFQKALHQSQSGLATLNWNFEQNVSWELGCNYLQNETGTEGKAYKVFSRLQVNFTTH